MAGGSAIAPKPSCHAPAALCGKQAGSLWKVDIPPMLAAQAAFPSGPLEGSQVKLINKFGDELKIIINRNLRPRRSLR